MKRYTVKLTEKEIVADGTISFRLEKPENFYFIAGQYMQVFMGDDSHTFSISAAPNEDFLMFTTRIRQESVFKQKLARLSPGDTIEIEGPGGQFILPDEESGTIVFLVGGIGITPVRSMLLHRVHEGSSQPLYLFYSNRTPEGAVFLDELSNLPNPNYEFVPTMTDIPPGTWTGEEGYITMQMIGKYVDQPEDALYYVVGPPGFVGGMVTLLTKEGISRRNLVVEEFPGY